jgi:hypothetical protein
MKYSLLGSILNIAVVSIASAQTQPVSVIERAQPFRFTTLENRNPVRHERFCLPRGEKLLRVKDVITTESNDKSNINIRADIEANCLDIDVVMPPPKGVCTNVPKISGLTIDYSNFCQDIPTTIGFAVRYEVEKVPDTLPEASSTNPSSTPQTTGGAAKQ